MIVALISLVAGLASVTAEIAGAGSAAVLSLTIEQPFSAPIGLVRTPLVLRTVASTTWYGWLYEEESG